MEGVLAGGIRPVEVAEDVPVALALRTREDLRPAVPWAPEGHRQPAHLAAEDRFEPRLGAPHFLRDALLRRGPEVGVRRGMAADLEAAGGERAEIVLVHAGQVNEPPRRIV